MLSQLPLWGQNLAAVITLLLGLLALWRPRGMAHSLGMELRGLRGRAEFRIGFGGFMIGGAGYVLWAQHPVAFSVLGFLWLGGALARILAWMIDQPVLERAYLKLFLLELTMATLLLWQQALAGFRLPT